MALKVADIFINLKEREFRVLATIEQGMRNHEYVPIKLICALSGYAEPHVTKILRNIHYQKLIIKGKPDEYVLLKGGYDALALRALVKQDILDAIGEKIGVGKESDVYDGIALGERQVAIKFHRLGRTSFQHTRRLRGYAGKRLHVSSFYEARLAAEREHRALKTLHMKGISVPEPIGQNRHVIVMEFLEGKVLQTLKDLPAPAEIFTDGNEEYCRSILEGGLNHGDFSEYNIIIQKDYIPWIFDWPQSMDITHPNAESMILRDIEQVEAYFIKLAGRMFGSPSEPLNKITQIADECRNVLLKEL